MHPVDAWLFKQIVEAMALVAVVVLVAGTGSFATWLLMRSRRPASAPEVMRQLDGIAARLDRLDSSVETVAVEVERISEAQRFTTKLLAERPAAVSPSLPDRQRVIGSTTPH